LGNLKRFGTNRQRKQPGWWIGAFDRGVSQKIGLEVDVVVRPK